MKTWEHEGHIFTGIQTFMRSDYIGWNEIEKYDVVFLGVPLDYGASFRRGAVFGPKAVREYSYWDTVKDSDYFDFATSKRLKVHSVSIGDIGDVHITRTDPDKTQQEIANSVSRIRSKTFPLIVGGDHSISYSTITGCLQALPQYTAEDIAILHLDAHLDMETEYLDYPRVFHGNPFRLLIDEGVVHGHNHFVVGLRGLVPAYLLDYVKQHQVNTMTATDVRQLGSEAARTKLVDALSKFKGIYVTIDIDCIDPSEVKGTGTPLPGGLPTTFVLELVRSLKPLNIIGFELTELAPELDPTGFSNIVAVDILWHFLSFGFSSIKSPKLSLQGIVH